MQKGSKLANVGIGNINQFSMWAQHIEYGVEHRVEYRADCMMEAKTK